MKVAEVCRIHALVAIDWSWSHALQHELRIQEHQQDFEGRSRLLYRPLSSLRLEWTYGQALPGGEGVAPVNRGRSMREAAAREHLVFRTHYAVVV